MERKFSRRGFVGAAVAGGAGITALSDADARVAIEPGWLTYRRADDPQVSVSYPPAYHLYTHYVTDVTFPMELFSISDEALNPGPSPAESGMPDLSGLSPGGVFLIAYASDITYGGTGIELKSGAGVPPLIRVEDAGAGEVDRFGLWAVTPGWAYTIYAWVGQQGGDLATLNEIVASFIAI